VGTIGNGVVLALSDATFESAQPAEGDWSGLVVRNGPTPKTQETTGFAGSSLAEHQDRTLHVRGICTLRPDGLKQVEQQLFNPHGSIFHFLSDEAPENGGLGRAPDACTYISAGIGFCFMTQLGRYAKISKRDLRDYRIVQDTHFSLGGASGGTGAAGEADPVETHVHLASGEDDEFARTALDMAEQTCFLHALCRTELKTRIRIRAFDEIAATAQGGQSPKTSNA
jgi:organic hydroperoxide reductase OsmC/OhrA